MRTPGPTRDHRSNTVISQAIKPLSMLSTFVIPPSKVTITDEVLACPKVVAVSMAMMLS
jgi:hypothetical protein